MSIEDPHEAERKLRREASVGEIVDVPDLEDDEWEPIRGGVYKTVSVTPREFRSSGDSQSVGWLIEDGDTDDRDVEVFYTPDGVTVGVGGRGNGLRADAAAELSTDRARELAVGLYQAAEELDHRLEVTDSEA